ncbi:MAG: CocE/NonD family hydrolase [Anaerolineae bacterium]
MSGTEHQVWTDYHVRIPMRDGAQLAADVYRPADSKAGARFPAILMRTPYDNRLQKTAIENARYYAAHGYAVILNEVRGRGDSEGEFQPYRHDGRDGYDAIEWCAAQPWCDGKVATLGGSYLGHVQWLAALEQPPHLVTMVVLVTPSDPFVEWPTGTHGPMHLCWLHLTSGRTTKNIDIVDWNAIYEHLPLMTMDEAAGFTSATWREELEHIGRDEYWASLCYQNRFDRISLPVLHISGWYDDEQIGTPLNFAGMTQHGATEFARSNQKLLMGPWGHRVNSTQRLGEVDFGPDSLIDLRGYQLRWLDHWLKGDANGVMTEPPVRLFIMGENTWRDAPAWPLPNTQFTRYYLHSGGNANSRFGDGALSTGAPAEDRPDHYRYDPARPVPFLTEATSSQIGGPDDYAAVERRDDVLVYRSEPLAAAVEITGPIRLELYAASSAVDTDFTAQLVDVHPTGFVQRLCDGVVRARFREGMEHASLITPGEVYRYEIDLWNTAQVFLPGHRIGLAVSSSAFPKYDRNLNTGEDPATGVRMVVAEQTVYHDGAHPSALILPVIPREG